MAQHALVRQLMAVGINDIPQSIVGKKFWFTQGDDEIIGVITGLSTTDDDIPMAEVSNKEFAGLKILHILLNIGSKATLVVDAPVDDPSCRWRKGTFRIW